MIGYIFLDHPTKQEILATLSPFTDGRNGQCFFTPFLVYRYRARSYNSSGRHVYVDLFAPCTKLVLCVKNSMKRTKFAQKSCFKNKIKIFKCSSKLKIFRKKHFCSDFF